MTDILDLYGESIKNDLLDAGHAPKCTWAANQGTPFPKGRIPWRFEQEYVGYEGAWALRALLGSKGIRPDIVFYPNGQVDLYCPGGALSLSLSEAMKLARLLDHQKPDESG